ncbi:unnamed protein product [Protopolystoma xenopodis]|uniref:Separase n=1 Tax=Protopolystoma xenopodis TaxID=117903 RepID=A0A448WW83_9PLAT|nr:unnamed protein product [Protopolystoma xenopodis]
MHAFNQGLGARAAALIFGCSSGRPRWEGRHEPYTSTFNHLFAGCPFVLGLLWDVTDKDMDRFTVRFITHWLCTKINTSEPYSAELRETTKVSQNPAFSSNRTIGSCIFRALSACKLPNLIGKSVIVYGLPVYPSPNGLLMHPKLHA